VRRPPPARRQLGSSPLGWAFALVLLAGGAQAEERRTVAILPVVVHALEDHAYLRDGLADMLASRLGQHPGIAVLRVDDLAKATTDADTARATAKALGAQWVLYGSFTRFGDGASLDVQCVPVAAPGEPGPRSIFVQSGQLAELIPRLDGVAERVAAHVLGRDAGAGPAPAPSRSELDELRRRLEALERQPAAPQAPAPAPRTP
jgi:TolB-like protein